ncbi:MAG: hypothetical protein HZB80_09685 [Deltaproteobacteria bacterium]|nr:hypothetical protein [Deltaproteobacteria bacterium]
MHIKRFREKTLEEALRNVKAALGEDAIILSTKKTNGGAEVLAAVDFDVADIEKKVSDEAVIKTELTDMKKELSDIKCLFASLSHDNEVKGLAGLGSGAVKLYEEMLLKGVHEEVSKRVIKMAAAYKSNGSSLKERCAAVIRENVSVCNPLSGGGRPKLLALVGPAGVGKTMSAVKLAVKLARKFEANVGIISIDDIRPGASETLKACGRSLGISSVDAPAAKDGFNEAVWNNKDKDIVLIDTPGKNPKDMKEINRLKDTLNCGLPVKTALVLSAATRDDSLFNACKGFGILPIDCMVFTKIDEADSFGSILNTSLYMKKPVAYLCNGQRIPENIMAASNELIGNLILGGGQPDV